MNNRMKKGLYKKWWVRTIRSINYFCFRWWWLYWIILILIFLCSYLFCPSCSFYNSVPCDCPVCDTIEQRADSIPEEHAQVRDTIPKAPQENCRVHFSGVFMGGEAQIERVSKIYEEDQYSEFVGSGSYPKNNQAFPKAVRTSFDGIAIDKGTHLIIYSKENFQGEIVLDVIGPAIVCNKIFRNEPEVNHVMTDVFPGELQSNYPPSVRRYSDVDMRVWSKGSCRITCEQ
jgi:hypothetical protein